MANETKYEPFGAFDNETKKSSELKVFIRKINGSWYPEFVGDNLTHKDVNRIIGLIPKAYRRYTTLSNLARLQKEREAREALVADENKSKQELTDAANGNG